MNNITTSVIPGLIGDLVMATLLPSAGKEVAAITLSFWTFNDRRWLFQNLSNGTARVPLQNYMSLIQTDWVDVWGKRICLSNTGLNLIPLGLMKKIPARWPEWQLGTDYFNTLWAVALRFSNTWSEFMMSSRLIHAHWASGYSGRMSCLGISTTYMQSRW